MNVNDIIQLVSEILVGFGGFLGTIHIAHYHITRINKKRKERNVTKLSKKEKNEVIKQYILLQNSKGE